MKKFLLLLCCLPMLALAKDIDDSKYLTGAVPEVNGQVMFQQTFAVKDKNQQQIYDVMKNYITALTRSDNQLPRTKMVMEDAQTGTVVARLEEWMVFKKKPLSLDRTRFRYMLTAKCSDGKCHMELTQIVFYYEEDMEGNNGKTYRAEEWINDANALNKAKTKLIWGSAKFRRKTVDRVEEVFAGARNAFETPAPVQPKATELLSD